MSRYSQVFIAPGGNLPAADVYRSRRKALLSELESVGVFCGIPRDPGSEEVYVSTWNKLVQDPAFLFLTGINQAGCKLLLDPSAENAFEREVLFLPKKDANKEFWTGAKIAFSEDGLDEIRALTGFKTILPESEFWNYLEALLKRRNAKVVEAFYLEFLSGAETRKISDDHNARFAAELREKLGKDILVKSLAEKHFALRVVLDSGRIQDCRRAQAVTNQAFCKLLRKVRSLETERSVGLLLDYGMQVQSDGDLAFPTIVAAGENACCLHYVKKDEALKSGELLLLDFGIRIGTQHSDISRTLPVNGRFDPLQRLLYGIVLDAQKFHQANVRPGKKLADLDPLVWDFILDALRERFVAKGGKFKLLYDRRPHGVSHLIGEQIHEGDPFRCYMQMPLEAGMLISNEPGLYGNFEIELDGIRYREKIGIRIEDDLLLTEDGCEDISAEIPKEIEDLEKWMA